MNQQLFHWKK